MPLLTIAAITGTEFLVLAICYVTQPNNDKGLKQPRPQATPIFSMLHCVCMKTWEWPGDEARSKSCSNETSMFNVTIIG